MLMNLNDELLIVVLYNGVQYNMFIIKYKFRTYFTQHTA